MNETLKSGDVVVIHTSLAYDPVITIVPKDEFQDYFSEDSGWTDENLAMVIEMEVGDTIALGEMDQDEIKVTKV